MMNALVEVDEALVGALEDTQPLTDIIGTALYNGKVPSTDLEKFPRVSVGEANDRDATGTEGATFNTVTRRVRENIHLWSRKSRVELMQMYAAVYDSLHRSRIYLGSGDLMTGATVSWVTDFVDPDGKTYHAIVSFEATAR